MEDIVDFPSPVSQIPKPMKHFVLALNVYGYAVSKINIFPYHILEQQREMQRINLLLISEDVEIVSEEINGYDEELIDEILNDADCSTGPKKETK